MKRIIFLLCIIFYICYFIKSFSNVHNEHKKIDDAKNAAQEYEECNNELKIDNYSKAADCYSNVISKYSNNNRIKINVVKLNYAVALTGMQEFDRAKQELQYIIDNETNEELINKAKDVLKFVNKQKKHYSREQTQRMDIGDYYSDIGKITKWKNPKKIKVYIAEDEQKEIFKKAFNYWDESLLNILNFVYTDNEEEADITAYFEDNFIEGDKAGNVNLADKAGIAEQQYRIINGVNYLYKVRIRIPKQKPYNRGKYTDNELYSTILHEIGHAIGISGHSNSKGDIMYFSTETYLEGKGVISKRDVNTVKKMYGNI